MLFLEAPNSNCEKMEPIYLRDCVTDRSGSSNRYLNVTFCTRPTDRGRNNKTLCDCLLSLFIALRKHRDVRGSVRMQGYIFLSCHFMRFAETYSGSDTLAAHSQTARAERRQHLWWNNKLKRLWCCSSVSGWFQLLFKAVLLRPLPPN